MRVFSVCAQEHFRGGVGGELISMCVLESYCCCLTPNPQPSVCSLPPGLGVWFPGSGHAGGSSRGNGGRGVR